MLRPLLLQALLLAWLTARGSPQASPYAPDWCRKLPRPEYAKLSRVLPRQNWFEIYRVAPGVFALYEPHQAEEVISFLIVGNQRALLFDTGMGIAPIRPLVEQLTALPVMVLNSHTHADHVGGNHEFEDVRGLDLPYTRQHAQGFDHAAVAAEVSPENVCGDLPHGFAAGRYAILPWKITAFVHGGSVLDLGGRKLEVISTPGHTPDSISLLDRRHRLLLVGDTFYPGPIWLFVPETDWPAYKDSVARLAQLGSSVDHLLPAHNLPLASPGVLPRLRKAIRDIDSHRLKPRLIDGHKQYDFDGFSIRRP
jgi:glyoxylase-like metal-dependent hydrolase (beta-lactamase superfamily II)